MKVKTGDVSGDLVEAEVVESGEGGALDAADVGVWIEEKLFPAHEEVLVLERLVVVVVPVLGVV